MRLSKEDFTIGAIYRVASHQWVRRSEAEALLVKRTSMTEPKAKQLAEHWYSGPLSSKNIGKSYFPQNGQGRRRASQC